MGIFDALTGKPAKQATAQNLARLDQLKNEGMGYLDAGKTGALDSLGQAAGAYQPYTNAGTTALDNLAAGNYTASPGLQAAIDNSIAANDRTMASRGMLASGNNIENTNRIVSDYTLQDFQNWQNQQNTLAGLGLQATGGVAGVYTNQAGVYQNDANSRVGLASNIATGQNNATTQGANAQMQGSANALGLGLNLAKLGTGFLGGAAGGAAPTTVYGAAGGYGVPTFGR